MTKVQTAIKVSGNVQDSHETSSHRYILGTLHNLVMLLFTLANLCYCRHEKFITVSYVIMVNGQKQISKCV